MARPRRNNADYFPHDTGMRKDGRITVLRSKFGLEGYAIHCMTLELLTDCESFTAILDDVELQIIAADFGVTTERLTEVWSEAARLRLLEFSGSEIYCSKLVDSLQPLLDERERQRIKALKRWEKDGKTKPEESSTTVKPGENNAGGMQSKVKESKVNGEYNNLNPEDFKLFREVSSLFDPKFYNEKKWLKCYDELIRLDNYSEENILHIVKHFRADSFWSANFQTLVKLRLKNKEGVLYVNYFNEKLKKTNPNNNGNKSGKQEPEIGDSDRYARAEGVKVY